MRKRQLAALGFALAALGGVAAAFGPAALQNARKRLAWSKLLAHLGEPLEPFWAELVPHVDLLIPEEQHAGPGWVRGRSQGLPPRFLWRPDPRDTALHGEWTVLLEYGVTMGRIRLFNVAGDNVTGSVQFAVGVPTGRA